MNRITNIIIVLSVLIQTGCNKKEKDNKDSEKQQQIVQNKVTLSPEQIKYSQIELGKLEYRNLRDVVKANGKLDLPPHKIASVNSYIGGVIKDVRVIPGSYVDKGQILAILEHPDIIAIQQDYLKAKSELGYFEKDYKRQKKLYEDSVTSGKKYQLALSSYKSQRALVESLKKKLEILGIQPEKVVSEHLVKSIDITAPIQGNINTASVTIGTFVNPTMELFSIIDTSHTHLILNIYEKDIDKINIGQKVRFTLSESGNHEYFAEIFKITRSINQTNKSLIAHAEINSHDKNLLYGRYAEGRIETGSGKSPSLPSESIVSEGDLNYIFVKLATTSTDKSNSSIFERIEVKKGISDMGFTEVHPLKNISSENIIVIKGAYYLNSELEKNSGIQ